MRVSVEAALDNPAGWASAERPDHLADVPAISISTAALGHENQRRGYGGGQWRRRRGTVQLLSHAVAECVPATALDARAEGGAGISSLYGAGKLIDQRAAC